MSPTLRMVMAVVLAAMTCGWMSGGGAAEIAVVAKRGDHPPGTPVGSWFTESFWLSGINGRGEALFGSEFFEPKGGGFAPSIGLWMGRPGRLKLVVRRGDRAPGTSSGVKFDGFALAVLNGAGELAFMGAIGGGDVTTGNSTGIWVGRPTDLKLVVRAGDRAPGTPAGVKFRRFEELRLNLAGDVAIFAELKGSGVSDGNKWGFWVGRPGSLKLVARRGDRAPGTPNGARFRNFSGGDIGFTEIFLNPAGEVAFLAGLKGPGVTDKNDRGIWVGPPGSLKLVAREGDRAPDKPGGVTFKEIQATRFDLNGAGEVAFLASLKGLGDKGDHTIWVGRPGSLKLAAFSSGHPVINGAGEVAFNSEKRIWAGRPGDLKLVAWNGMQAPDTPAGVSFRGFSEIFLNGAGQVAFVGFLKTADNVVGIWAGRRGDLRLVIRQGDTIEVAPGDVRTVGAIERFPNVSGNEDGKPSRFSEGGQLTSRIVLTSASLPDQDAIVVNPPEAPEVYLLGERPIGRAWRKVFLPRSFKKPVVISGPPSFANKQPGVVQLRRLKDDRFQARFQEWSYLDGKHPTESASFLVMNEGRHKLSDGSIWEVGTRNLSGNRKWSRQIFKRRFPGQPEVFLTVLSFRGRTPVTVRARGVTKSGFEMALTEEEKDLGTDHPEETVGYLAVYSAARRGTITGGVDGTDYRLRRTQVDHRFKRVLGERIRLEEEKSKDQEIKHTKEQMSVMTLGRGLFAQQASDRERDTTALRRR